MAFHTPSKRPLERGCGVAVECFGTSRYNALTKWVADKQQPLKRPKIREKNKRPRIRECGARGLREITN